MASPTLTQGYAAAWSVAYGGSITVDVPVPGGGGHVALLVTVVVSYVGPDTTPVTATYGGVAMTLVGNVDRAWTFELLDLSAVASDDLVLTKGLTYDLGIQAAWVMSGGPVVRVDADTATGSNPGTVTTTLDPGSKECVAYVAATSDKSGGVPTSDIDSASGTGQTVLSEAAYPGNGRVMFTARKYDVAASQGFGVTVGGAVGHGIGVAAALYGPNDVALEPDVMEAEVELPAGVEVVATGDTLIAPRVMEAEVGFVVGLEVNSDGPLGVMLTSLNGEIHKVLVLAEGETIVGGGTSPPSSGTGASALDDLTDVDAPSPSDGDILVWDDTAGEWITAPPTPSAIGSTWTYSTNTAAPPTTGQIRSTGATTIASTGTIWLHHVDDANYDWSALQIEAGDELIIRNRVGQGARMGQFNIDTVTDTVPGPTGYWTLGVTKVGEAVGTLTKNYPVSVLVVRRGGAGGGVTAHSALTGLTADDHTQYLKETDIAAKGDLFVGTANDTVGIRGVGSNGQVLTADSAETTGVKWATAAGGLTVEETDGSPSVAADKLIFPAGTVTDLGSGDVSVRELPTGVVGVKAYHATTQGSLAASTVNPLSMNTEDWDTDGFHSTSVNTSRFTIPAGMGGRYLLVGRTLLDQQGPLYWRLNGTTLYGGGDEQAANTLRQVVQVVALVAGDYVELCEFHGSGTGTAGHASARHVQTEGIIYLLGSGNVSGLDTARAQRTSGDLTLNSTTWANVDTGLDLVVPAQAGDVLLVSLSGAWNNEAVAGCLDGATLVSGSPVNYISGGGGASDLGVGAWLGRTSEPSTAGGSVQYVVQAGDISGGNVTLRLRYRTTAASNKTLYASSGHRVIWSVVNLRGGAASRDIGYEFAYVEFTSDVTVSATTSATANTIVTAPAIVFDGNTAVWVEVWAYAAEVGVGGQTLIDLYDGSSSIGIVQQMTMNSAATDRVPVYGRRRLTPSAGSHTYSARGWRTGANGAVKANTGGAGTGAPGYIRITKA